MLTREQIRTAFVALSVHRVDRTDRAVRARYDGLVDAFRAMLLELEGGNMEVVEALFAEWDTQKFRS